MFGQFLRRDQTPSGEERALQVTPWGPWQNAAGTSAGVPVSADLSLQLLTVYGCVNLISDTIATLPRDVFRDLGTGGHESVAAKPRWFEQPNPSTDILEFITQSMFSLLLDGNTYWAYGTDGNFMPSEIRVLNPAEVEVRAGTPDPRNPTAAIVPDYYVRGQRFRGNLKHIKGIARPGALKGLSPVESARQSLGIGLAVQEFAGNFYKNGATLSAVVEVPGAMTQDQARALKEGISRTHGGTANAHLPGVITNGGTWKQISVTPEQGQFLESRQFQAAEIAAQMFLVDPSLLGIAPAGTRGQNLTYANLEQRGVHFVQFTLLRWITRLERAFTQLLPAPQYMKFNVSGLQRADFKTRFEAYQISTGNKPFQTVNEVRELEEWPPLPGNDTLPEPAPAAPGPLAVPSMNGTKQPVGVT